jgi:hypothetical protein
MESLIRAIRSLTQIHLSSSEVEEWMKERNIPEENIWTDFPITINYEGTNAVMFSNSGFDYILSLSPLEDSESQTIVYSEMIPAYKSIPTIFFHKTKNISSLSKLDPISSHNIFVVQALQKVVGLNPRDEIERNDISSFIKENIDTINKIRSFFQKAPEKIGSGADGMVFSISDFAILKIFKNEGAFQAAQQAMERINKNPEIAKTEAKIYDAGILGECKLTYRPSKMLYYYIMEKMTPMESILNYDAQAFDFFHFIGNITENLLNTVSNTKTFPLHHCQQLLAEGKDKELKEQLSGYVKSMEDDLRSRHSTSQKIKKLEDKYVSPFQLSIDTSKQQSPLSPLIKEVGKKGQQPFHLRSSWLSSLIEEIMLKVITNRTDLHMGNIGITGYGDLRYFDPAFQFNKNI